MRLLSILNPESPRFIMTNLCWKIIIALLLFTFFIRNKIIFFLIWKKKSQACSISLLYRTFYSLIIRMVELRKIITHMVLATDFGKHFDFLGRFKSTVASAGFLISVLNQFLQISIYLNLKHV